MFVEKAPDEIFYALYEKHKTKASIGEESLPIEAFAYY
jgi:hypothetical protein